jgi:hypothetical protein
MNDVVFSMHSGYASDVGYSLSCMYVIMIITHLASCISHLASTEKIGNKSQTNSEMATQRKKVFAFMD